MKPRIFISSSKEVLEIAEAIQQNLDHDAEVTGWNQDVLRPSQFTLEGLIEQLDRSDFGVFVFSPDDIAIIRGKKGVVARDNVVFELGLCIGRLGRERSFVITPHLQDPLHLPTDLLGLTTLTYEPNRSDRNFAAAVGSACGQIRAATKRLHQWTGTWHTRWGEMRIQQDGDRITGTYGRNNGRFEAELRRVNQAYGRWYEGEADNDKLRGELLWNLALDGKKFAGQWSFGFEKPMTGIWEGWRTGE